jgi:hypothetical protein
MPSLIGFIVIATFVAVVGWLAVLAYRHARKDRELEAQLPIDELMKKRAIEGASLGPV